MQKDGTRWRLAMGNGGGASGREVEGNFLEEGIYPGASGEAGESCDNGDTAIFVNKEKNNRKFSE